MEGSWLPVVASSLGWDSLVLSFRGSFRSVDFAVGVDLAGLDSSFVCAATFECASAFLSSDFGVGAFTSFSMTPAKDPSRPRSLETGGVDGSGN